jgi:hypothetical protein
MNKENQIKKIILSLVTLLVFTNIQAESKNESQVIENSTPGPKVIKLEITSDKPMFFEGDLSTTYPNVIMEVLFLDFNTVIILPMELQRSCAVYSDTMMEMFCRQIQRDGKALSFYWV